LSVNLLQNNSIGIDQLEALVSMLEEHPTLKSLCGNKGDETELDMSGKQMGASGAIMFAAEIVGNGAISSVNLLQNNIGIDQAKALVSILKQHPTLKSLCGNSGDETELDMSGKEMEAGDAIMLATEIAGNGALSVLSLESNSLLAAGGKALAEGLKDNQVITELNISSNRLGWRTMYGYAGTDMSGIIALADVIPDMGAVTSLNLASNSLHVEGAKIVAASLPKCT
jgi:hypothetical protein